MYVEPFRSDRNWPVIGLAAAYLIFLAWKAWKQSSAARSIPSRVGDLRRAVYGREGGY
jgi:hypothetical protein